MSYAGIPPFLINQNLWLLLQMYDDGKFDFNRAEPVWISSSSPFKLLNLKFSQFQLNLKNQFSWTTLIFGIEEISLSNDLHFPLHSLTFWAFSCQNKIAKSSNLETKFASSCLMLFTALGKTVNIANEAISFVWFQMCVHCFDFRQT